MVRDARQLAAECLVQTGESQILPASGQEATQRLVIDNALGGVIALGADEIFG